MHRARSAEILYSVRLRANSVQLRVRLIALPPTAPDNQHGRRTRNHPGAIGRRNVRIYYALETAWAAERHKVAEAIRGMDLRDGPALFYPGHRLRFDAAGGGWTRSSPSFSGREARR